MGGSAVVDSGNTVSLCGTKLQILGELTGETPVATIDSSTCNDTMPVLEVSTVTEEGMTSTTLAKEYGKFAVTPETDPDAGTTKNWYIHKDGMLMTDVDVTSIASQITNMSESGTVTVRGKMQDSDLAAIASALNSVSSGVLVTLEMEDVVGLTEIPQNTFTSCSKLQSITIPEGVTNIGYCAFRSCGNLTSITLPDSLKSIGPEAFELCSNLATVNLGNGLETLDAGAFNRCTSLTEIEIPASLNYINANGAFRKCVNLTDITVAEGSEYFEAENGILFNKGRTALFAYPSCTGEYDVPDTVTKITGAAFNGSDITAINLNKTETIEMYVFEGCTDLTSITFPDSLTSIGSDSFGGCTNLASLSIGSGLKTISMYAFSGCSNLTDITISSENTTFTVNSGALFKDSGKTLVCYPACPEQYTIPDGVEKICRGAFPSTLKTLVMPVSVKTIESYVFSSGFTLTVNYKGSEEDRAKITINNGNDNLTNATWICNYKTSPNAVGDIVFNDGTAVAYTEGMTLSDSLKADAVGVVYALDAEDKPMGLLGLKNSTDKFVWAPEGTTGYTTSFTGIICVTEYGVSTSEATFDGVTDGSGNWAYICSQDPTGTADAATNYPAFNHVNSYASAAGLTGTYATGWYMPSIAELCAIFNNVNVLNTALAAAGGTRIENLNTYCSSSQSEGTSFMWSVYYDETSVKTFRTGKDSSMIALCVRAF
jgi:hypothetical protein